MDDFNEFRLAMHEAEKEKEEAKKKLQEAEKKLQEAEKEKEEAKTKQQEAEKEKEEAKTKLQEAEKEKEEVKTKLQEAEKEKEEAEKQLHYVFRDGLPILNYEMTSSSDSKPSISTSHVDASAEMAEFNLHSFAKDELSEKKASAIWNVDNFRASGESDISYYCRLAVNDVSKEVGAGITVAGEYQIYQWRPDLLLLTHVGRPCGVIEVKKEAKCDEDSAFNSKSVFGELFDYMQLLRLSGIRRPIGLLTTYEKWQVFWFPDKHTDEIMASEEDWSGRLNKMRGNGSDISSSSSVPTTPIKTSEVNKKSSPPPLSPVKSHSLKTDDSSADFLLVGDDDAVGGFDFPRKLNCSSIVKRNDGDRKVCHFIGTVLYLMVNSSEDPSGAVDLSSQPLERIVQCVSEDSFSWKRVMAESGLDFTKMPRSHAKSFYFWQHLDRGETGRCFIASTTTLRACCVVKMYFKIVKHGKIVDTEQEAETEKSNWLSVYNETFPVFCKKLAGMTALVMPHFAPVEVGRRRDYIELVKQTLERYFVRMGKTIWFEHKDLHWRHVGLTRIEGKESVVLLDLCHISKHKDSDMESRKQWLKESLEKLEKAM